MATTDQTPTYNLKAVIRETGLKPDTLRAWERRYGLPQPKRTPGRHRLYSQRDIETLKWLLARQEEGLSISRAVALWRQLEDEGKDPLHEPAFALPELFTAPAFILEGEALTELQEGWFSACLSFDETKAEWVLTYALALYPVETVCLEILLKSLSDIGQGWYEGDVTVQQEHFASELAMRRVEAFLAAAPAPTRPGRVVIGCAPDDLHTFPPLLLAFLLKQRGWEAIYLGARVPAERMDSAVAAIQPHLVILTAQQLSAAATLLEMAQVLQSEQVPLAFGGRIFNLIPSLHQRIPGHFLGERLEQAPHVVEHLLMSSPPLPPVEPIPEQYQAALAHFRERRMVLEADIWQQMGGVNATPSYLSLANESLARNIHAALTLGDMDSLCTDIAWVEGLLDNQEIPRDLLSRYLNAYHEAALSHLDARGKPIVDWLSQFNGQDKSK